MHKHSGITTRGMVKKAHNPEKVEILRSYQINKACDAFFKKRGIVTEKFNTFDGNTL